ncbi:hypothetical protein AcW2_005058 [Taiwanofungus camphoratus]|nr:hypothetical protein AcW2_005058 [Antrodia cinnamomea]
MLHAGSPGSRAVSSGQGYGASLAFWRGACPPSLKSGDNGRASASPGGSIGVTWTLFSEALKL